VEGAKLRSRLDLYYQHSGKFDAVRVSVPKGGYVPRFENGSADADDPVENPDTLPSIAVLPFLNLSADVENKYFSEGLVEELTAALTRSNQMRVAARTATFQFKRCQPNLEDVRRALNVDRVIEGSVRKSGERLRIAVQLVDIPGSRQLWSRTYDRTLRDAFEVQAEIAREVVLLVCSAASGRAPAPGRAPRPEAFDLYLRGQHLVDRWDLKAEQQALDLFEQAVAADPEYALAYVGIAAAVVCLANMGFAPPVQLVPRATAALDSALRLDPGLPDAHAARATILARYEWDWQGAEQEYRLAIQLAPGLARTHHEYATELLAMAGRFDQAYAEWRRARELDPHSPAIAYGYPWILLFHRRFVESEREFRRLLDGGEVYESERIGVAFALMGQGRYLECLNEFSRIAACLPRPASMALHAWILALAGKTSEARDRLNEVETVANGWYIPASYLAAVHFALGDSNRGFELLEQGFAQKEPTMRSLKEGFDWDPIRSDPRFSIILKRLWPELR
jgi:TolB-like protein/Tfp pilus assembly protein PilF